MAVNNLPESVLVRLKNKLCIELGLDSSRMKLLVDKFVRENMHTTGAKTHYTRVNMCNEFSTDRMTMKVFFKFLRILPHLTDVEFSVKIKTASGRVVTASETYQLSRRDPTEPVPPTSAPAATPTPPSEKTGD